MWGVSYWVFPVISGLTWLGMLLGLLIHWTSDGKPHYPSMDDDQTVAYISDIGAFTLKPLFITGSIITTIFLDLSLLSDILLRHPHNTSRHKTRLASLTGSSLIFSYLSFLFAILGTAGLILLSIFDTYNHPRLHNIFLLLFIVGYVVSAAGVCWEYQRLGVHFRQVKVLRYSFWIKLVFILVEVALAIAFGVTQFTSRPDVAAVLEWVIAFIFTFYIFSFFVDLIPAARHSGGKMGGQTELENEMEGLR